MTMATAPAIRLVQPYSGLALAWQSLRDLKILLPFAVLIAIWWAVKARGDFPDSVLVSPLRAWHAFVHLTTHGVLAEYASTSLTMIGIAAVISMLIGVP